MTGMATFVDVLQAQLQVGEPLVVEHVVREDGPDVGDDQRDVFGEDDAGPVLDFLPEEVEPVVAVLAAALLAAHEGVEEALVLVGVEVLNGAHREVPDELDAGF